jgi:hypothetical protein
MSMPAAPAAPAILSRILEPDRADLTADAARYFLRLDFSPADQRRVEELSAAAKKGQLPASDQSELDSYLLVADFVGMLQSKARKALKRKGSAS